MKKTLFSIVACTVAANSIAWDYNLHSDPMWSLATNTLDLKIEKGLGDRNSASLLLQYSNDFLQTDNLQYLSVGARYDIFLKDRYMGGWHPGFAAQYKTELGQGASDCNALHGKATQSYRWQGEHFNLDIGMGAQLQVAVGDCATLQELPLMILPMWDFNVGWAL